MKKIIICFVTFLSAVYIISCAPMTKQANKPEEKFRSMLTDDGKYTYENYFTQLAGIRGEVQYKVFTEKGETNPDIKIMQVVVDKKDSTVEYKNAKFQYQFNVKTGFIKLAYLEINGKPENFLMGSMSLGVMLLESSTN
jgi:hypothetical protein